MNQAFPPIQELLPHRGPAILIDEVLSDSEDSIRVAANINRNHPYFMLGRGVPSWVGIELMAQAVAAHAGLANRRTNTAPRIGMLLGVRSFNTETRYFHEGELLEITSISQFGESGDIAACACTIQCGGKIVAQGTLIIMQTEKQARL
ncbi:MAG: hypothetical protein KGK44_01400 [Gammaproteobacteria bacterium]|nr:hypothetical protein [Gammaproteobacteria bacterium]